MADLSEIIAEIDSLAVHCRPPLMSVDEQSRWKADWCADLREYPIEAIRTACQRWRNGTDRKFPLPGQLRPLVVAATRTTDRETAEASQPWKPLNDAEYNALTLREKIRHHQILAAEASGKAGPMWRGGQPATAEEMPDSWRIWRQQAANHYAEVQRLRQYLNRDDAA